MVSEGGVRAVVRQLSCLFFRGAEVSCLTLRPARARLRRSLWLAHATPAEGRGEADEPDFTGVWRLLKQRRAVDEVP